jgi:hypothetical protein
VAVGRDRQQAVDRVTDAGVRIVEDLRDDL